MYRYGLTIGKAFYLIPFDAEIFIQKPDATGLHFNALYFDNALSFFDKYKHRKCNLAIVANKAYIELF